MMPLIKDIDATTPNRHRAFLVRIAWAAIALGIWLRIEWLGRKSHWEDECWTVDRTSFATLFDVVEQLRGTPFPPLYYVIVWSWEQLWQSNSVPTIRAISMLAGVAAVPCTYLVWRRILSPQAALWSVALVALNSFHIWYSRDAKMYAIVWLLSMVSCGCYLLCVTSHARLRDYAILGICNGCLLLTSYVGVVVLAAEFIHAVPAYFLMPKRRRPLMRCLLATLLCMIPFMLWLPYAFQAVTERAGVAWIRPVVVQNALADVFRLACLTLTGIWIGGLTALESWGVFFAISVPVITLCVGISIVAFVIDFVRQKRVQSAKENSHRAIPEANCERGEQGEVILFLILWTVLPVIGAILFSIFVYPVWGIPRYFMAVAPAPVLLMSVCLAGIRPWTWGVMLGVLVLLINLLAQQFDHQANTRVPWGHVSAAIAEAAILDDAMSTSGKDGRHMVVGYYGVAGLYFDQLSLKHAFSAEGSHKVPLFYPLYDLPKEFPLTPLAVVVQSPWGERRRCREEIGWFLENYECRRVYEVQTFEELWSRLPTPFEPVSTEVWICRPPTSGATPDSN